MQVDDRSSSRFKSIVKKAKESRSSKEKFLLSSKVSICKTLQKRKNQNLSQSFVLRQTIALSAKNKHLTSALSQSRQLASELQENLQKMQGKMMELIMKLNSREVALEKCMQEHDKTKNLLLAQKGLYGSLYKQLHLILDNIPVPTQSNDEIIEDVQDSAVKFSVEPKRIPVSKSLCKLPDSTTCFEKWKPDLSCVQEKLSDDSMLDASQSISSSDLIGNNNDLSSAPKNDFKLFDHFGKTSDQHDNSFSNSLLADVIEIEDDISRRKKRRCSSMFSLKSFNPDEADFNISLDEQIVNTPKDWAIKNHPSETNDSESDFLNVSSNHVFHSNSNNESPLKNNPKSSSTVVMEHAKRRKANFKNTSYGEDSTLYVDQSMDLTKPLETCIILGKPKHKKKVKKGKKTANTKKKRTVEKQDENFSTEKDVYNCSSDSFVLNPDKKIELAKEGKTIAKPRSLPMANITNNLTDHKNTPSRRSRRKTAACISYKEPNILKKLRQGDTFFQSLMPV